MGEKGQGGAFEWDKPLQQGHHLAIPLGKNRHGIVLPVVDVDTKSTEVLSKSNEHPQKKWG